MPNQTPITVAILARDLVAGRALELLLQSAEYNTRFLVETVTYELTETLDGVQLLLLAPTLSAKHREYFLNRMRSRPATAEIPVLELITAPDEAQAEQEALVLWPCRMEDLKERIEAALLSRSARGAA